VSILKISAIGLNTGMRPPAEDGIKRSSAMTVVLLLSGMSGMVIAAPESKGPQIKIPNATVQVGNTVEIKISYLGRGTAMSALQFDVAFDVDALRVSAVAGNATTAAGKSLATSVLANGRIRFLIFGMNQTSIADGDVVVLKVQALSGAKANNYTLAVYDAAGSTGSAQSVAVRVLSGVVHVKR
jgi:hypothetical protein